MTYSSDSRVTVGEQPQWGSDLEREKVRVTWTRPSTTSSTSYPAYYYLFYSQAGLVKPASCTSTIASQLNDDNCYVKYIVGATGDVYKNPDGSTATDVQKKQNFANWYSYYRTRNLTMVSGTMSALNGLDGSVRVAWQAINTCNSFSTTSCKGWNNPTTGYDNRIRALDEIVSGSETHRQHLYDWLARFPANNATPLRTAAIRAGNYFDTTVTPLAASSPWAQTPPNTAGTYYSCRRSVSLLMTDGIWNSDSVSSVQNATNASVSLPTGHTYSSGNTWTPSYPYTDTNSNSIADIAMYFWSKDLAPTIDNKITPYFSDRSGSASEQWVNPKNDPATWQHLSTHAISLGLGSVLVSPNPVWGGDTYSGDYSALKNGTKSWPTSGTNISPGNAYDLWHAALSGRGQFYSAESGESLKRAFKSVIDSVSTLASSGGGAGLTANSTKVTTTTAVYLAIYSGDWSGSFQAIPVQNDGSLATLSWDAGERLPYSAKRNIFTINNGSAQQFNSCTSSLANALNVDINGVTDGLCSRRIAWLRGFQQVTAASWSSSTNQATYTVPGHGFSTGDSIIVSGVTPIVYNGTFTVTVSGDNLTVNLPLSADPGSMTSESVGVARYYNFRARTTALGDIMNSTPTYSHTDDYGYGLSSSTVIGRSSYNAYLTGKSSNLPIVYVGANDGMLHAFGAETVGINAGKELFAYVPAGVYSNLSKLTSPNYSHKFFVDGSPTVGDVYIDGWKTYLIGGLGAGGKSIYALDVSNASQFAQSSFNVGAFSPSSLVKWEFTDADLGLTFGKPQIVPNTTSQWAGIFGNGYNSNSDGAYLFVVNMSNGSIISKVAAGSQTSNGLATPYLYDNNGDKIPDIAYAGDMKGNLWKFVNSGGSWSLGNGGVPLFIARTSSGVAQPITSAPRTLPHPNGGVMIYFGTGSYLTNSDLTNNDTQSFYGIWDNGTTTTTLLRANLQSQTITQTGDLRMASGNVTDWGVKKGCYVDLPGGSPSERILSSPLAKQFSTIENRLIFTTSLPTSDACDRGGSSWLMELSSNCGSLSEPVLDTNQDNTIDLNDTRAVGMKLPDGVGITQYTSPLWLDGEDKYGYKYITGSKGVPLKIKQTKDPSITAPGNSMPVRVYWRQIL
jgi:type IV pilus assembly protein PilY1